LAKWVLDAGHGGNDPGAIGKNNRRESDINLEAAYEAMRLLERNGETVLLTRASDIYISYRDRAKIANDWGADYFVSFHMNSFVDSSVTGTEVFIYEKGSKAEGLASLIKAELVANLRSNDRGIKEASYIELRETNMPAVIIEAEFLSNEEVEKTFDSKKYGYMVAKACLSFVDKVLIDIPHTKAKIPTREGWRVCVGYYRKYQDAEEEMKRLQGMGIKGIHIVPYPEG
jgi:N-acetylmuramoyl-L-alanine amidase